jgi:glycosyltransferase involved in cell wall biosynthesis
MRVCMVAYSFYECDNRVMRYAEALAARGDEVDVMCLGTKEQPRTGVLNGVRVFRIQCRSRDEKTKFSYLRRILWFFAKSVVIVTAKSLPNPYRVVHVHSVPDFLAFAGLGARMSGAKIILDIHDLLPEFYGAKFQVSSAAVISRLLRLEEKASAAYADHVIAPNHLWREKLISRSVSASKCSVIMNYPDPAVFYRRGQTRECQKFVMIYPGSLNWHQGVDIAIRAFAKISSKLPAAEFRIFGEGPTEDDLKRLVSELEMEGRVVFRRPLPLREIAAEIENSDLVVVPKRKDLFGDEAFSTKVFECMAMGVPVIVSDTKVDRFYFNDQVVTFFKGGNVEHLAACMVRLIQDPEARLRQAERAKEFMRNFDWGTKQKEYLSLVDGLVGKKDTIGSSDPYHSQVFVAAAGSLIPETRTIPSRDEQM